MVKIRLQEVMARRGFQFQAEVARKAGISANSANRVFRGIGIRLDTIDRLCKALECQPGDLLQYVPDGGEKENLRP